MGGVDPEFFHYLVTGRTHTKAMEADDLSVETDVLIPKMRNARFDCHATPARSWQYFLTVVCGLPFESLETGHGNDTRTRTEFLRCDQSMLQFATAR